MAGLVGKSLFSHGKKFNSILEQHCDSLRVNFTSDVDNIEIPSVPIIHIYH